jgi:predicted PurR-regulated permease PerM
MPILRGRLRRQGGEEGSGDSDDQYIEIDPGQLTGIFTVPQWLRDIGLMSWLLVGVAVLVLGLVSLTALTQVIVAPVITAAIVAAVASPLVRWFHQKAHLPRGLASALVLVLITAAGVGMFVVVVTGISGESSSIAGHLNSAKDTIAGWLKDLGLDPGKAEAAKQHASTSTSDSFHALLNGISTGVTVLTSLGFFLAMTLLSLFFLLKDGPVIRGWVERHIGVPAGLAHSITHRVLQSLRGYFLGVTIVAAFNAAVVALGCLILGVPLIGTIAAVTFVGAYIPYLGAWGAGAFAVLIALGTQGEQAAVGLIIVELLANGILQQLVQPFAMGAALGIHPLAVLVVTIAGGALFGAAGLILAAPATSAAVRIANDLRHAREEEAARAEPRAAAPAASPG